MSTIHFTLLNTSCWFDSSKPYKTKQNSEAIEATKLHLVLLSGLPFIFEMLCKLHFFVISKTEFGFNGNSVMLHWQLLIMIQSTYSTNKMHKVVGLIALFCKCTLMLIAIVGTHNVHSNAGIKIKSSLNRIYLFVFRFQRAYKNK